MKRLRPFLLIGCGVLVASVCVRLGFWQLSRLAEKQALNARLRAALAAPPRPLPAAGVPADSLETARFVVSGLFDEDRQILLVNRVHDGQPGVELVTPLRPSNGGDVILVNRGWVPADDGATANPSDFPVPGIRTVVGLLSPIPEASPRNPYKAMASPRPDTGGVWTMPRLEFDAAQARFPYVIHPVVLRQLATPGDSALPARAEARLYDETIHQSYAAQWFLFGTIALVGPLLLLRKRRKPPD